MICKNCNLETDKAHNNLCMKCYNKNYYLKNKEKFLKQSKKWQENNRDKIRKYNKTWQENNKEKERENHRRWRLNNLEKDREKYRRWWARHSTEVNIKRNKIDKEREKIDIDFKIRNKLRDNVRRIVKKQNTKKAYKTLDLLGCTIKQFKDHIEQQFKPDMSWENYGKWHIDHIIPCAIFDLKDPEQQKLCFHYTNLQPLWAKENLSKGAKIL